MTGRVDASRLPYSTADHVHGVDLNKYLLQNKTAGKAFSKPFPAVLVRIVN
jgi:hypothetical protein